MKKDLLDLTLKEFKEEISSAGYPSHRADQVWKWVYGKSVEDMEEMTDLPKTFINDIKGKYSVGTLDASDILESKDGTKKYLWRLEDGEFIESVLIKDQKRRTICLSTQVGCKFRCPFCASGLKKLTRNLTAGDIIAQVFRVQRESGEKVSNIVFMGMGEPLDNFANVEKAISIINDPRAFGIGARKITISTCGLIPGIIKLMNMGLQVELSVSLHSARDEVRDKLVPVNRKYPVKELVKICKQYFKATGRVITFEYTLIKGVNDSLRDAEKVAGLAKEVRAKVNIIRCNAFPELGYEAPDAQAALRFKKRIQARGVGATIRRSRGEDILAACGQLAAGKNK